MAAPQPPQLTLFPDPPLLTDDEDTYNAKAGDTVIAQQKFIPEINYALTWIGQQVSAVDGYRQSAATSAGSAADSAGAADSSKKAAAQSALDATSNGKAQVDLAKNQVTLAQQAATAAQSAAQAAGAAAGLPGGRVPFTVLQINSAGNVSWGDGLIDKTSAVPGQALMLGTGKTPQWAFPGQQIGDVLISARNPGALYLPADGGIRLQSAYSELFAKVGLIGGGVGLSWPEVDSGGPSGIGNNSFGASQAGTVLATFNGTASLRRSTNRGVSWATVALPNSNINSSMDTDGQGTWIIAGTGTQLLRSTDDGQTWQPVTVTAAPSGYTWNRVKYCGANTWVVGSNGGSGQGIRSTNNGASFGAIDFGHGGATIAIESNGKGVMLAQGPNLRKSTNYGATWVAGPTISGQAISISTDKNGTWVLTTGATSNGVYRSLDDAMSFSVFPVAGYSTGPFWWVFIAYGFIFVRRSTVDAIQKLQVYIGNGVWQNVNDSVLVNGQGSGGFQIVDAGNGVLVGNSQNSNGKLVIATPQFPYDTSTQFALPLINATSGTAAYIKAKELA
ncbi:WD40/YVTN/BNR-like repeat-containing protein [Pseudomonas sp. NPDC088368]|uniref:WD40/YVTN/BNR-like repeat-containing protein n=1 Tax=Pseudomonas sp. NPDC088368 TaxID=3364453 RepID=UPI0037F5D2E9